MNSTTDPRATQGAHIDNWVVRDYYPGFTCRSRTTAATAASTYWRRPEAYLDPGVRAGISVFSAFESDEVETGVARLAADLESGEWRRRNAGLLELDELDLGYRLVVASSSRQTAFSTIPTDFETSVVGSAFLKSIEKVDNEAPALPRQAAAPVFGARRSRPRGGRLRRVVHRL